MAQRFKKGGTHMQAAALADVRNAPLRHWARSTRPLPVTDHVLPASDLVARRLAPEGYGAPKRANLPALLFIAGMHALLLIALVKFDVVTISRPATKPLVVELLSLPKAPPPATPPPPEEQPAPEQPDTPAVVIPKAEVVTSRPVPPIIATTEPPPARAVIVAPPAPAAPSGPITVADLDSKILSAPPPRYPAPSLRLKEQGTVILSVLVGTDGSVEQVLVSQSSGHSRLDKAALEAVRRWRWSPTMVAGAPVQVRGLVDIPFVLRG